MLQWLRQFDTNKTNPKPYKQGSTIVGTKTVSLLNKEYFFQYVLLNLPHRNFQTLCHPNHEQLTNQLQWFGTALHHFGPLWTNNDRLKSWLKTQGHRDFYISTILSYVASLCDLFYLLRIQVIGNKQLKNVQASTKNSLALDSYQLAVLNHIDKALDLRERFSTNHQIQTYTRVIVIVAMKMTIFMVIQIWKICKQHMIWEQVTCQTFSGKAYSRHRQSRCWKN